MRHTIRECLTTIGVTLDDLGSCQDLRQEFAVIKKAYFKKVLVCHPDKGGDAALFRQVHASFEVLRDMYDNKKVVDYSFATDSFTSADETAWQEYADMPTQSWDYFYTAAEEKEPAYRVEPAKSGRSRCKQTGLTAKKCQAGEETIEQGEIRIGFMDWISGDYGRWNHLKCWRVPSKIWLGLTDPDDPEQVEKALLSMNEVLLSGFSELSEEQRNAVVAHVMEKDEEGKYANWAKLIKRKKTKRNITAMVTTETEPADSREVVPEGYHFPRARFLPPVPGKNGAVVGALAGKTVVLTGIFPEVGGGTGLKLGRAKVKAMVESFGGRVTTSVSGKTDILIVGKEPGRSKVQEAEMQPRCHLISLKDVIEVFEGGCLEDIAARPMVIPEFSAGYPSRLIKSYAYDTDIIEGGHHVYKPNASKMPDDIEDMKPPAKATSKKRPTNMEDMKPAAKATSKKRPADDKGVKPAAKKHKGKSDESLNASGEEIVSHKGTALLKKHIKSQASTKATAKKPKRKKAAATKKKAVKKLNEKEPEETETKESFEIVCDGCKDNCTERSWFVDKTEQDFCFDCFNNQSNDGVEQSNGVNV